jgi:hypothetical protein
MREVKWGVIFMFTLATGMAIDALFFHLMNAGYLIGAVVGCGYGYWQEGGVKE